ncbi:hypothetical protein BJY52DRAFT_1194495 [Lactarius psammicola]|nr:hypothetical protein BJY52DRAFT_1194495 [Lactarius psammicola]
MPPLPLTNSTSNLKSQNDKSPPPEISARLKSTPRRALTFQATPLALFSFPAPEGARNRFPSPQYHLRSFADCRPRDNHENLRQVSKGHMPDIGSGFTAVIQQ